MNYACFVHLRATSAWLRLSRQRRREIAEANVATILGQSEGVRLRLFDAEGFTAECSDIALIECDDPAKHYFFMERLRDSVLVTEPYFEVVRVVLAIEDGYRTFESSEQR